MFIGEFHHNIDDKGRIAIPSKYREILGNNFVITRGIEHCIYVYPNDTFNHIVTKLESLPFTKKDVRAFTRFFIYVYPNDTLKHIVTKLESLPFTKKDARAFTRFFMSGATAIELDKQGRVNVPSPLINYANLSKKCVIVGTGDRLEIWDEEAFNE